MKTQEASNTDELINFYIKIYENVASLQYQNNLKHEHKKQHILSDALNEIFWSLASDDPLGNEKAKIIARDALNEVAAL